MVDRATEAPVLLRLAANNLAYTLDADVTIEVRYPDGSQLHEVCLLADAHAPVTPRWKPPTLEEAKAQLGGTD